MPRKAPPKCCKCAALHIDQVHQIHGSPKTDPQNLVRDLNTLSDGCYNPKLCPPKQEQRLEQLQIDSPYTDLVYRADFIAVFAFRV